MYTNGVNFYADNNPIILAVEEFLFIEKVYICIYCLVQSFINEQMRCIF